MTVAALDVEQAGTGCRFACGFGGGFGGVFHRSGGRLASVLCAALVAACCVYAYTCEQVGGVDADEVGQLGEYLPLLAVFSYGYIHMRYVVLVPCGTCCKFNIVPCGTFCQYKIMPHGTFFSILAHFRLANVPFYTKI